MFYEITNQLFQLWWYSGCRVVAFDARDPRTPERMLSSPIAFFLDKKVRKSGLFYVHSGLFSGIPDFEHRTPGIPNARARSPEWGLGFRNSGLFSGLSASLFCVWVKVWVRSLTKLETTQWQLPTWSGVSSIRTWQIFAIITKILWYCTQDVLWLQWASVYLEKTRVFSAGQLNPHF